MKKKSVVLLEKHKFDNASYNLCKYIIFLEIASFTILGLIFFIGVFLLLFGLVHFSCDLLRISLLLFVIFAVGYIFLVKPLLLIMYAICKILINTEK